MSLVYIEIIARVMFSSFLQVSMNSSNDTTPSRLRSIFYKHKNPINNSVQIVYIPNVSIYTMTYIIGRCTHYSFFYRASGDRKFDRIQRNTRPGATYSNGIYFLKTNIVFLDTYLILLYIVLL